MLHGFGEAVTCGAAIASPGKKWIKKLKKIITKILLIIEFKRFYNFVVNTRHQIVNILSNRNCDCFILIFPCDDSNYVTVFELIRNFCDRFDR